MHLSRLAVLALFGPILLSYTQSLHLNGNFDHPHAHDRNRATKRDILGNIFSPQQPPASAPSPAPASAVPPTSEVPAALPQPQQQPSSTSSTDIPSIDPSKTNGIAPVPSLIGEVPNPPTQSNITGSPVSAPVATSTSSSTSPTLPKKKQPAGSNAGTNQDPSSTDGSTDDPDASASNDPAAGSANKSHTGPTDQKQRPLSPGVIVLIVIIILAVLTAVLFSCYKIRQSRRRRRESWSEDFLKNHAGSVGYTAGGGYGMVIGHKEKPDLWRKNLDLFHRE
ncbi:hypothetical protein BC939DRAFT_436878 [Gamsiella multidivaricata]|uniref:uncharacterized protein n=1 Tax=Gamsiella multidivaricata TaxID=101098 RepID=UPI0022205B3A|nr:uncharacterized protein BC939DRAFT_436878 [Gamsiella multidivaricata]KAG0360859.1 hypothetical protein BGZ54_009337 [Gamsiella multidivaricata]KAI7831376.1 hypothetical protein BC939DRAFT_436878 [Gamsiella multidivaricata]